MSTLFFSVFFKLVITFTFFLTTPRSEISTSNYNFFCKHILFSSRTATGTSKYASVIFYIRILEGKSLNLSASFADVAGGGDRSEGHLDQPAHSCDQSQPLGDQSGSWRVTEPRKLVLTRTPGPARSLHNPASYPETAPSKKFQFIRSICNHRQLLFWRRIHISHSQSLYKPGVSVIFETVNCFEKSDQNLTIAKQIWLNMMLIRVHKINLLDT